MTNSSTVNKSDLIKAGPSGEFMLYKGEPFTGKALTTRDDGRIFSEESYFEGFLHGLSKVWNENGHLESEETYFRNIPHGEFKEWDEDGNLLMEGEMRFGQAYMTRAYDPNGELIEEYFIEDHPKNLELQKGLEIHFTELWKNLNQPDI